MSELSKRSGVAIPSIKFYVREGLVPPGVRSSPNQSIYDDSHVTRLRLIRALIDVGGLSIAAVADVLGVIDDTEMPIDWAFGKAQRAIPGIHSVSGDGQTETHADGRGVREVDALIRRHGWQVSPSNPGRALAARVIDTYAAFGHEHLIGVLSATAQAAEILAAADLAAVVESGERTAMVETVVIGTVLGDSLMAGVRRLAQEHASHVAFPDVSPFVGLSDPE
ncbi:MAG: MerR family transcriptional regulator [Microbacteriaceae bacterium]